MEEDDILSILSTKYQLPYWVFIREFRNATGFDATRSADALAFGMYRSRGQVLIAFEKKVSRSDWLRELKDPDKAEPIAQYCDYFNVVVPAFGIARIEELPIPWGLMVVDRQKRKVTVAKKAELLKAAPFSRPFLCALVKQAIDVMRAPSEHELREAHAQGFKEGVEQGERECKWKIDQLTKLQATVEEFEKASGVHVNSYDGPKIGAAVAVVRQVLAGDDRTLRELQWAERELTSALEQVKTGVAAFEKLKGARIG